MTYLVRELRARRYRGKPPAPVRGPDDAVPILKRHIGDGTRETFLALLLNARHECIGVETISIGSLNASIVHPRLCVAAHKRGYVAVAVMWCSARKGRRRNGHRLRFAT